MLSCLLITLVAVGTAENPKMSDKPKSELPKADELFLRVTAREFWQWMDDDGKSDFDVGEQLRKNGVKHRFRTLSLQKGTAEAHGTAWYLQVDISPVKSDTIEAYRGKFEIVLNPNDGHLLLKLNFTRKYVGRVLNRLDWDIDNDYTKNPEGVEIEIPLIEGKLPRGRLQFVVIRAYRLGADGVVQQEKQIFTSKPKTIRTASYMDVGDVFELTDEAVEADKVPALFLAQLAIHPPPGFRFMVKQAGEIQSHTFARAFHAVGALDLAAEHYTKAIEKSPNDPDLLYGRADACVTKDRVRNVIIEKFLSDNNAIIEANRMRKRRNQPALELVDEDIYLELKSDNVDYLGKAKVDLTKVIKLEPKRSRAFLLRAEVNWRLKEYGQELDDLTTLTTLEPRRADYFDKLARRYITPLGGSFKPSLAKRAALKACELTEFRNQRFLLTLANAYGRLEDFDNAAATQQKAVDLAQSRHEFNGLMVRKSMFQKRHYLSEKPKSGTYLQRD